MKITIFDVFNYIFKWKLVIIAANIVAVILVFAYVNMNQTYNSTAVFQMNDKCISEGTAPDGKTYDMYEIVSPGVLSDVIKELELNRTVNSLRENFQVTGITPDSETAIMQAMEKEGQKHKFNPNFFTITYTGRKGEQFRDVRDILEYTVDGYVDFYMQKYINKISVNDVAYDDDMGDYDYLDMVELLDDNMERTAADLEVYYESNGGFRSTSTGYSFLDIATEYRNLMDFKITELYSNIFRGQISKNEARLIETYTQRKEQYLLEQKASRDIANVAKTRMESFSEANKNVPNAYNKTTDNNNDNLAIIDGIDGGRYKTVTTYDDLMDTYIKNSIDANDYKLDADRCDEVIAKFRAPQNPDVNVAELTKIVEKDIDELKIRVTELNKIATNVMNDYNNVNAASHVTILTGVNYYPTISAMLYILIAVIATTFAFLVLAVTVEIVKAMKTYNAENSAESADRNEA